MAEARISLLGAYRVGATDELVDQAIELKYPDCDEDDRTAAEEVVRDELGGAVLFEVELDHRDSRFRMDDFGQEGSDQAPYDEAFLSADGENVIASAFDVPQGERIRVAFFLHFVDPSKPLRTPYGPVAIPPIGSMPERLARLVPYEPVD